MTRRPDERSTSADPRNDGPDERLSARVEPEEIEEASQAESEGGEPPSIDEIRLEAYYRYLQREDGDDDGIASWLAAESDLRGRPDPARADRRPGVPHDDDRATFRRRHRRGAGIGSGEGIVAESALGEASRPFSRQSPAGGVRIQH
jgi:hypothetical protein